MIGAIVGDIVGSVYERHNIKTTDFPFFRRDCRFTDDSVLSVALADSILNGKDFAKALESYYYRYPHAGYGASFQTWARSHEHQPYNSWGNGSAMRVSPVGWAYDDLKTVLQKAEESAAVTHNHLEGIKGAQAVASSIFLARTGNGKEEILRYVELNFGYELRTPLDEIREWYSFDVSCQGSVPQAITAFLESADFEDAVRKAISIGGDSDTIACIAGAIAEAFYGGVPETIAKTALDYLDERLLMVVRAFTEKYCGASTSQIPDLTDDSPTAEVEAKIVGGLWGAVVGDALGVPVEFRSRDDLTRKPVAAMTGFGSHNQPPGTWSDDSSLMLATADALMEGYDLSAIGRRFVDWYKNGYMTPHGKVFDVGGTTADAILDFAARRDPSSCGMSHEHSNGNGSLMRILPVPLYFRGASDKKLIQISFEVSAVTHAHVRSQLCCALYSLVVNALLNGANLRTAVVQAGVALRPQIPNEELENFSRLLDLSILDAPVDDVASSGYVLHTLEASLWCCYNSSDFREAVLKAVNLGLDTDTTGIVTGGLAGIIWGRPAVPDDWIDQLVKRDHLERLIDEFSKVCMRQCQV